jgi:hypothetical protein
LAHNGTNIEYLLNEAQNKKAEELAQAYVRGEEDAIALVHKHLENAGVTIDDLVVKVCKSTDSNILSVSIA